MSGIQDGNYGGFAGLAGPAGQKEFQYRSFKLERW